jgi:hypothetical protein
MQAIPMFRLFFTRELIKDYSLSKFVLTILFDPIPYQLWFIRDLIFLVILSPLIGYLTLTTKGTWIFALVFLWYFTPNTFKLFSNESFLFFTIGSYLALNQPLQLQNQGMIKYSFYFFTAWISMVTVATYFLTFNGEEIVVGLFNHTGILTGILAIWYLYDVINQNQIRHSTLVGYTFIIYALHEPMLTILVKGLFYLCGKTDTTSLLIYLLVPLVTILICVFVGNVWKKYAPRSYDIATGGR